MVITKDCQQSQEEIKCSWKLAGVDGGVNLFKLRSWMVTCPENQSWPLPRFNSNNNNNESVIFKHAAKLLQYPPPAFFILWHITPSSLQCFFSNLVIMETSWHYITPRVGLRVSRTIWRGPMMMWLHPALSFHESVISPYQCNLLPSLSPSTEFLMMLSARWPLMKEDGAHGTGLMDSHRLPLRLCVIM